MVEVSPVEEGNAARGDFSSKSGTGNDRREGKGKAERDTSKKKF